MTERWTPEMLDQFASRTNALLDRLAENDAIHDERMAQIEMNVAAVTQQQVVNGQMLQELHVIVGDLANGLTGIQTEVRRLIERNGGQ
jgi:ABC-type Fe2+-enterobactin transport system substrate-binding protein